MDLVKKPPTSIFTILITIVIVLVSLTVLFFIYKFVGGSSLASGVQIIKAQVPANIAHPSLPSISGLYEGGDYAVSVWVYINSYNINRNTRKHVLEIGGANFSTLLIALGAFKNTLMVRTHSRDSESVVVGSSNSANSGSTTTRSGPSIPPSSMGATGTTGTTATTTSTTATGTTRSSGSNSSSSRFTYPYNAENEYGPLGGTVPSRLPPGASTSFYDADGKLDYYDARGNRLDSTGKIIAPAYNPGTNSYERTGTILNDSGHLISMYGRSNQFDENSLIRQYDKELGNIRDANGHIINIQGFQNATPGSSDATRQDGSLTARDLDAMFAPLAMDDSLLNATQICDIPVIDMQRWVNISVALSGRTIDVYMDGKLARLCLTPSYYKVDPTGIKVKITERGGFDGYINGVSMYNYPLSPADIYHIYQAGPTGNSAGVATLISSLFTGGK